MIRHRTAVITGLWALIQSRSPASSFEDGQADQPADHECGSVDLRPAAGEHQHHGDDAWAILEKYAGTIS